MGDTNTCLSSRLWNLPAAQGDSTAFVCWAFPCTAGPMLKWHLGQVSVKTDQHMCSKASKCKTFQLQFSHRKVCSWSVTSLALNTK